ncbi:DegV family protein [[Clostridium] polysaccharolyticum]|uniref:EDD domain protein, DegV family n=1 Tax=[Clostridium] polysaccharolyticum TaxID=29364 RepID=A0A1I0DWG8_9FIRM|nr:DegV family protein [[Clostridium] polysaccharolyticum]SET36992.1 EDD domain protein, DegV family [[Clostridium] polysaccharolyticum]
MYKLIGDSCTDVTDELIKETNINLVPLTIQIDEDIMVDDSSLEQSQLIQKMKKSTKSPSTACPAPEAYLKLYEGEEDVYVVTLSSKLSGSYNSAYVAKNMYLEEHKEKNIAVIDSLSAAVGQTLVMLKIKELADQGLPFEKVVEEAERYRDNMATKFLLESLENLRKAGRLSTVKAFLANTLNIKPIMCSNGHGEIQKYDQARGMKKALDLLIASIVKDVKNPELKVLGITHCNCLERAMHIKEELEKHVKFKRIVIVEAAGISTVYAGDGGVVVCY